MDSESEVGMLAVVPEGAAEEGFSGVRRRLDIGSKCLILWWCGWEDSNPRPRV
jgi:hypothetical protein